MPPLSTHSLCYIRALSRYMVREGITLHEAHEAFRRGEPVNRCPMSALGHLLYGLRMPRGGAWRTVGLYRNWHEDPTCVMPAEDVLDRIAPLIESRQSIPEHIARTPRLKGCETRWASQINALLFPGSGAPGELRSFIWGPRVVEIVEREDMRVEVFA